MRDLCTFARQNITADPPFSRLDLISCRNVLIYLGAQLQKRAFPLFHYALNPGGYLMLGPSETIGVFSDMFEMVDRRLTSICICRREHFGKSRRSSRLAWLLSQMVAIFTLRSNM